MYRGLKNTLITVLALILIFILLSSIDKMSYSYRKKRLHEIENTLNSNNESINRQYRFLKRNLRYKRSDVSIKSLELLYRIGDSVSVEYLQSALSSKNRRLREDAVVYSGNLQLEETVPVLINLLMDREYEIRAKASLALGKIGDTRAVGPLNERLSDFYDNVVIAATVSLGKLKDSSSVRYLVKNIDHSNEEIRQLTLSVLKKYPSRLVSREIRKKMPGRNEPQKRKIFIVSLCSLNYSEDIDYLTEEIDYLYKLNDRGYNKLSEIFFILDYMGNQSGINSSRVIINAFSKMDTIADHAQAIVNQNYDSDMRSVIVRSIRSDLFLNNAVKRMIDCLGVSGDTANVDFLIDIYAQSKAFSIRNAAGEALGQLKDKRATPILLETLTSDRCEFKKHAAESLGLIGDSSAVKGLENTLICPYSMNAAAKALDKLMWEPSDKYEEVHYYIASGKHDLLQKDMNTAIDVMRKDIKNGVITRFDSLYTVAYRRIFSDKEFIDYFIQLADLNIVRLFEDSDDTVMRDAVQQWRKKQSFYNTKYQYK